ncbi:MAG: zinc ribbon domain-containing protein [Lentisphaeraceae bacterium]|nr:zinc ribbon domain-containing protein [Lentisphaeraceae bacterium]
MEIQCTECGGKSPMGAIFCRECGAKLNMDDMKPKVSSGGKGGGFKLSKYAIKQLISLGLSVVIFGGLAFMFMDGGPALPEKPNKKFVLYAKYAYGQLTAFKNGGKKAKRLTLSPEWVSHYFTNQFIENQKTQTGDSTLTHKEAIFDFYDDNKIKIDLRSQMNAFGFERDITCGVVLAFENTDSGVEFSVVSSTHGKVPLPGNVGAENLVYNRLKSMIPVDDDLGQIKEQIKKLSISDGKLVITLK